MTQVISIHCCSVEACSLTSVLVGTSTLQSITVCSESHCLGQGNFRRSGLDALTHSADEKTQVSPLALTRLKYKCRHGFTYVLWDGRVFMCTTHSRDGVAARDPRCPGPQHIGQAIFPLRPLRVVSTGVLFAVLCNFADGPKQGETFCGGCGGGWVG